MSKANPYSPLLEDRDPLEIVCASPKILRALVDRLGPEGLDHSLEPGKWPAKFILSHLADCEVAFGFRLRQALSVDDHVVQPFDQDKWAVPYTALSGQHALEVFTVLRGWNLALIKTITPEQFARKVTHPERGEMTLQTLLEIMAGHDTNHLRQLEQLAKG